MGSNGTLEGFESVAGQTGKPVVADLSGGSNVVHIIDTVSCPGLSQDLPVVELWDWATCGRLPAGPARPACVSASAPAGGSKGASTPALQW